MTTFAQNFKLEMPGLLSWRTARPILSGIRARFELSVYGCWEDDDQDADESDIDVYIDSVGNDAASACHETAWKYIVNNSSAIEPVIRDELFKNHMIGWRGFQRDMSEQTDGWSEVRDLVNWESETAINDLYTLTTITLGPDIRDDSAVARFHFASSWDPEHGVDVLLHRNVLVEYGINRVAVAIPNRVIPPDMKVSISRFLEATQASRQSFRGKAITTIPPTTGRTLTAGWPDRRHRRPGGGAAGYLIMCIAFPESVIRR